MAPNPFKDYAASIAARETALREQTPLRLNMAAELQGIGEQTGAPGKIEASEIPSVMGLASQQAYIDTSSKAREATANRMTKDLPKYVSAYRNYLKWRYPTRYGGKSGGTSYSTNYSTGGMNIPDLTDPMAPPGFIK